MAIRLGVHGFRLGFGVQMSTPEHLMAVLSVTSSVGSGGWDAVAKAGVATSATQGSELFEHKQPLLLDFKSPNCWRSVPTLAKCS